MKTDMTPQQAITLYKTIKALINQFDRENDPAHKGDCAACCATNSVAANHCSKCGYNGSPKTKSVQQTDTQQPQPSSPEQPEAPESPAASAGGVAAASA